jgi:hypothetical protein
MMKKGYVRTFNQIRTSVVLELGRLLTDCRTCLFSNTKKQKGVTHMDNGIIFSINGKEERSVVIYVDTFFDLPSTFEDSFMKGVSSGFATNRVHFMPSSFIIHHSLSDWYANQIVQGSFSVLEAKNRDGVKTISFSLVVHPGGAELTVSTRLNDQMRHD